MENKPNLGEAFAALMGGMQQGQAEKKWWQSYSFPETIRFECKDLMNLARSALFSAALQSDDTVVYESGADGLQMTPEEVKPFLKKAKARLVYDRFVRYFYVTKNGAIEIERSYSVEDRADGGPDLHYLNMSIVTSDPKEMATFKEFRDEQMASQQS